MFRNNRNQRTKNGSFIAEAPLALWILFMLFTFPFIDMATVLLRYTFVSAAARDGALAAAQSKTYLANASGTDLSAVNSSTAAANTTASAFGEITVTSVQTLILATNISSHQVTQYTSPLAQPADTGNYLYELETIVQAQINPLINTGSTLLSVPGLTSPVPVTVASRQYCEYPQGLNN